jgi:hypothetical protein
MLAFASPANCAAGSAVSVCVVSVLCVASAAAMLLIWGIFSACLQCMCVTMLCELLSAAMHLMLICAPFITLEVCMLEVTSSVQGAASRVRCQGRFELLWIARLDEQPGIAGVTLQWPYNRFSDISNNTAIVGILKTCATCTCTTLLCFGAPGTTSVCAEPPAGCPCGLRCHKGHSFLLGRVRQMMDVMSFKLSDACSCLIPGQGQPRAPVPMSWCDTVVAQPVSGSWWHSLPGLKLTGVDLCQDMVHGGRTWCMIEVRSAEFALLW